MKVLTAEQMAYVDKTTIEQGTPGIDLMRNAGAEVFGFIERTFNIKSGIVVLAGKGNNGGDGFRVAELLARKGFEFKICLIGDKSDVRGDAATCLHDLEKTGQKITEIKDTADTGELLEIISSADLVIDAIFGTGLKGKISGLPASVIDIVNGSQATVVAVDIPSGVNATTGEVLSSTILADFTITFGCLKVGHVLMPGRKMCGEVHVVDIGLSKDVMDSVEPFANSLVLPEAASLMPKRPYNVHKGSTGKVFMLAGSVGMTGAATMSSGTAMRTGAGVVTVGCPASLNDILEIKLTEVMTLPLPEVRKKRCMSLRALGLIRKATQSADIVAIGPGLGTYFETSELVRRFLSKYNGRVVLDADGINAFKGNPGAIRDLSCDMVLTPHPGELSRLLEISIDDIARDPIKAAKDASRITGKIVLLKGSPTIITDTQGVCWINGTGNEGMATAGMGDVLTGIISGLAAQGLELFDSAVLGAYIHGLTGDRAAEEKGILGMMSGDVSEFLPVTLNYISAFS